MDFLPYPYLSLTFLWKSFSTIVCICLRDLKLSLSHCFYIKCGNKSGFKPNQNKDLFDLVSSLENLAQVIDEFVGENVGKC